MTRAMWFIWLLRSDARNGASAQDAPAQRDFVAWWLLWGRDEYPAVWSYGPAQCAVAMEPVRIANGLSLPRLLRRLHAARRDLQANFPLTNDEDIADFLCWYRLFGPAELACAPVLTLTDIQITEAASAHPHWVDAVGLSRMAVRMARSSPALRAGRDYRDKSARNRLGAWYRKHGRALIPTPSPPASIEVVIPSSSPCVPRPAKPGVNLIGFARAASGLGEDVRRLSGALTAVRFRHSVIDVPAGRTIRHDDESLAHRIRVRPAYRISIYCMSAFDMANLFLNRGRAFFDNQYRIGYWPWELPQFPTGWGDVVDLIDEIWAPTAFVAASYAGCGKPVHVVAPSVTVPASIRAGRRGHRSEDSEPYRFIYPFDPNSHLARKNPLALVRAFKTAFSASDGSVGLVLQVNGEPDMAADWQEVVAEVGEDARIIILAGSLTRHDALAVLAACDCLVSPHRSEGFGRNIAEALLLGVEVLATGFSGCMDFLAPDECITWSPQTVVAGAYPFGDGQWWADPSRDDMIDKLRRARSNPKSLAHRRHRSKQIRECYGAVQVGRASTARIRQILGFQEAAGCSGYTNPP